jgi:hypothetical protein
MMLHMVINNILIDTAEMNFMFCDTLQQREDQVTEVANFLLNRHLSKSFVANVRPSFYLVTSSKANEIIMEDDEDERLVPDLEQEIILNKSITALKKVS